MRKKVRKKIQNEKTIELEVENDTNFNSNQDDHYIDTSYDEEEHTYSSTILLEDTLGALQSRLENNPVWHVQSEGGYTYDAAFEFSKGATQNEIMNLEKALHVTLPIDYREFLMKHNGAQLFIDVTGHGACTFELLSINEILDTCSYADYPEGWFGIAYGFDGGMLAVNTNDITNDERNAKYLYWVDCVAYEDGVKLQANFETFLDRFIVCQGTDYWKWFE